MNGEIYSGFVMERLDGSTFFGGSVRAAACGAFRLWISSSRLRRIAGILAAALLAACATEPRVVRPQFSAEGGISPKTIYIVSHGWHTGVVFPGPDLNAAAPELRDLFGEVPYYEFGWGDERFYRARRITSGLAVKALFLPTSAVLHVAAVTGEPKAFFPGSEVVALLVRPEGFESLKRFILESFARDPEGSLLPLEPGIYGESRFFKAKGTYFFLNTCNTWTAKALRSAGREMPAPVNLTSESVMNSLGRKGGAPQEAPDAPPSTP